MVNPESIPVILLQRWGSYKQYSQIRLQTKNVFELMARQQPIVAPINNYFQGEPMVLRWRDGTRMVLGGEDNIHKLVEKVTAQCKSHGNPIAVCYPPM